MAAALASRSSWVGVSRRGWDGLAVPGSGTLMLNGVPRLAPCMQVQNGTGSACAACCCGDGPVLSSEGLAAKLMTMRTATARLRQADRSAVVSVQSPTMSCAESGRLASMMAAAVWPASVRAGAEAVLLVSAASAAACCWAAEAVLPSRPARLPESCGWTVGASARSGRHCPTFSVNCWTDCRPHVISA